jgi:alpha-beta hydrolase superfamily lysophospholipase
MHHTLKHLRRGATAGAVDKRTIHAIHNASSEAVLLAATLGVFSLVSSLADAADGPKRWPAEVREIRYRCTADDSQQPALFFAPAATEPAPLLVALHSWSGDYRQASQVPLAKWCIEQGWVFIHPDFRGPNHQPDATGSELVVQDILDAVTHARSVAKIDGRRIYLVGASGGGYTALLMAGRHPDLWAGVSAWVPITDLAAWHAESVARKQKYAGDLVKSCGGPPGASAAVDEQYRVRSPLTHLAHATGVPIDLNAGIHDGHKGSVPVSHTLRAFNLLAADQDRLSEAQVAHLTTQAAVPELLRAEAVEDLAYGAKPVLFRRQSGKVRVTLFDGGHEIIPEAALQWLARQRKER